MGLGAGFVKLVSAMTPPHDRVDGFEGNDDLGRGVLMLRPAIRRLEVVVNADAIPFLEAVATA